MKLLWIKLLVLSSFAFWGSGLAKHVHEAMEHHGRDASVEGDDDDDCDQNVNPSPLQQPTADKEPVKHSKTPCPVCQMLAAMMVHHSPPPAFAVRSELAIGTVAVVDRVSPYLHACFVRSARDPPESN